MADVNQLPALFNPSGIDAAALGNALKDFLLQQAAAAIGDIKDSIQELPQDLANAVLQQTVAAVVLSSLPENPTDDQVLLQQKLILQQQQASQLIFAAEEQHHAHIQTLQNTALKFLTGLGTGALGILIKTVL